MSVPFRLSVTLFLLLVAPSPSSAQRVATSFDQLQVLIEPGDKITVRDSSGNETTGKLESLSAHGLTLMSQGKQREWADAEVSRIFQRKQDSLLNGALWGVGGAWARSESWPCSSARAKIANSTQRRLVQSPCTPDSESPWVWASTP